MNNKALILLIIILAILSGWFFVSQNKTSAPTPSTTQRSDSSTPSTQQLTIEGGEFTFTPSTATLKQGQSATITFKNTGKFPHDFSIPDLGIQTKIINPGEQDTVTFTPDKVGTFSFICTVPTHADNGMTGTLTIQ